MKATVDKDTCTGCNLCVETCPDVFRMDDDDIAFAFANPVPAAAEACCREAADDCPVEAITVA